MLYQVCSTAVHSSALLLGFAFLNLSLTYFHKFAIGYMSGGCAGHRKTLILFAWGQTHVTWAVCFGSLVC